jgi:CheY-like chemotaxis protein
MLAVSDDGCGMDQATLAHAFEPFFTTKPAGQGTGLGLAMVYGIVKQNDGFIDVDSEAGRGTTFKIYLPEHATTAVPMPEKGPAPAARGGAETVLLVEDEPMVLDLKKNLLETLGYTVLSASTPQDAIRQAEGYAGRIHLLVTDVVMPGMNGRDLAERLLSLIPGLKCLFTSGYTADVIAHRAVLEEGVHFLPKPFSVQEFAAKVRAVLRS